MGSLKPTGPVLDLDAGLWAQSAWNATFPHPDDVPATLEMNVRFDVPTERFVVENVTVNADAGEEVTGALLREIRVGELVQQCAPFFLWLDDPTKSMRKNDWGRTVLSEPRPAGGKTDLQTVAVIYRLASISTLPPLKTVASKLDVSQSTATRLVSKARAAGHVLSGLGPSFSVTTTSVAADIRTDIQTEPSGAVESTRHASTGMQLDIFQNDDGTYRVAVQGNAGEESYPTREAAKAALALASSMLDETLARTSSSRASVSHGDD